MSIKLVTGVPGSGKSYYAVNQIKSKYFVWDDEFDEFVPRKDKKCDDIDVLIFTNIENLRLPHINLKDYLLEHEITFDQFFTVPYQEQLLKENPGFKVCIFLDEIQRDLPAGYRNTDVLYYFQYHRHLGHDIYLMAQTSESVCKHIVALVEFEVAAIRDTHKLGDGFKYDLISGGISIGQKKLSKDLKVFGLYTSFKAEDHGQKLNPLKKRLILFGLSILFLVFMTFYAKEKVLGTFGPQQKGEAVAATRSGSERKVDSGSRLPQSPKPSSVTGKISQPVNLAKPSFQLPEQMIEVPFGGMWSGDRLLAVQFFGDLVPTRDFTFSYRSEPKQGKVFVMLPLSLVESVQVVRSGGYYRDSNGNWTTVAKSESRVDSTEEVEAEDERRPIDASNVRTSNPRQERSDRVSLL